MLRCLAWPQRLLWAEVHSSRANNKKTRHSATGSTAAGLQVPISFLQQRNRAGGSCASSTAVTLKLASWTSCLLVMWSHLQVGQPHSPGYSDEIPRFATALILLMRGAWDFLSARVVI